jgi:predicted AAA+ superfamily ATPase
LLEKILSALALQIGNEVSYNELAQLLSSDKGTIEKYIDWLSSAFSTKKQNDFLLVFCNFGIKLSNSSMLSSIPNCFKQNQLFEM